VLAMAAAPFRRIPGPVTAERFLLFSMALG
jgi:hypothetical protein